MSRVILADDAVAILAKRFEGIAWLMQIPWTENHDAVIAKKFGG